MDAAADSIATVERLSRDALDEARAIVSRMAAVPPDVALGDAVDRLVSRFRAETGLTIDLDLRLDSAGVLPRESQLVLLRCLQEALANVRKHAAATRIGVRVSSTPDGAAQLAVTDDGRGFDVAARRDGFGLDGMTERVALAGGELDVSSSHGGHDTGRAAARNTRGQGDRVMIRLLIVDDHPVVRAGLVGILSDEPGFEVVGEASDGEQAVRIAAATRPDVVLMDLRMPGVGGVGATAQITAAGKSKVLILTTYETDDQILAAIEAGASGYLLKASPQAEIVAGIRSVAAGQTALSPHVAARLVERMRAPAPEAILTARETEVLQLVARGNSNKQIAVALGIGESTVKTHLLKIFEKLGVADRTRAVTLAMERGLLPS